MKYGWSVIDTDHGETAICILLGFWAMDYFIFTSLYIAWTPPW